MELDDRNEKLGYKIREAQMQKIPYMLVIGDREVAAGGISPRRRDGTQLELMSPEDFAALVEKECLDATKGKWGWESSRTFRHSLVGDCIKMKEYHRSERRM